ncbi:tetratricopeptide repeat-containing hybrid sensor histidine kinase/response regulator [Flavobacterium cyclinae]|uniref:tetratricopeptide repeat-containing hybrid sensor histidine kinase/response regulator n=1 Tax=Flavobacterium cyclinae TaxID=2895947 RepID=UPI001E30DDC1|nr:ATP-binding protein [Flavobacterium cyclinae]UGS21733.1 ATP-binding protein [Flavobacterium cyclinae]
MKNLFFILFILISSTNIGFSQSAVYKEAAKITDSSDYYLEVGLFNKEDKKSYSKAILFTEKAIEYAKKNNLEEKLGDSYLQLATIFFELEKNDLAIDYYIRAVSLFSKKNPKSNIALAYYGLGKCYLIKNNIDLAETYFEKAATVYEKLNFSDAIELINLQKAIIKKEKGYNDEASAILKSVIDNINDDSALISTKTEAYIQLSELELIKNNYPQAIDYLNLALLNNKYGNKDVKFTKRIYKLLSTSYEKNNNILSSNLYLKRYVHLTDSLSKLNNNNLTENTVDKIQFDKQLKTIEQLDKERKSQQKTLQFSKLISILSIALISILSLLSLSLYKNNKIRTSTNKLLKDKNKELTLEKEKAERASKARADFLSTVSHELRTPLNAINGITYLLLQEKPKVSQLNYLKSLEFSGNYLLNFINDILEINRLESDKVFIEKINFNLLELCENISASFKEFINENNINFHLNIDRSVNYNLKGDPTKLSQIFINLLNNAIKFSKDGDVWFTINVKSENPNSLHLFFEVKDNGIGIAKDKQEAIFDSFSQGSVEINRTYGGTGLGLSIVKKILEIMGSQIHLQSEPGKGSTFSFELEFEKGINENITIDHNVNIEILNKKNILLVEDNKINQMITQKMLEKRGISCKIIDNGEDAIHEIKDNNYDLILMDVHLPGINGTEATSEIRKFNTQTPIIALTAISLNENREMLLSYGMNEVITKPFEPEHFYNVITKYLSSTE